MPITGAIPLPETGMDAFLQQLQQGKENQYREALGQQAQAKAMESQMMANLLKQASQRMGGGAGGASGNMDVNRALMVAGALHLPTQVVEGNLITPFGTFKVGESPEEKGKREVAQSKEKTASELEAKSNDALKTQADSLLESGKLYKKLYDLHKQYPNLTGVLPGFASRKGFQTSEGVGEYVGTTKKLQTAINKAISQRGGIGSMQIAATVKPDIGNQENYNLGMIKSGLGDILSDMSVVNSRYRKQTGEDLPQFEELKGLHDQYSALNQPAAPAAPSAPSAPGQQPQQSEAPAQGAPQGSEVAIYDPQGKLVAYGSKANAAKFLMEPKHRGFYQKVLSNG